MAIRFSLGYGCNGKDSDVAYIEDRMEREQHRFRIVELGGGLRKEDRIRRLISRLARSGLWFPESLTKAMTDGHGVDVMAEVIEHEVKPFPVAQFDDFLDMLSRVEDLEEMKLLKFPRVNTKLPRTMAPPSRNGTTRMSI